MVSLRCDLEAVATADPCGQCKAWRAPEIQQEAHVLLLPPQRAECFRVKTHQRPWSFGVPEPQSGEACLRPRSCLCTYAVPCPALQTCVNSGCPAHRPATGLLQPSRCAPRKPQPTSEGPPGRTYQACGQGDPLTGGPPDTLGRSQRRAASCVDAGRRCPRLPPP